jgi:hypothetical protein
VGASTEILKEHEHLLNTARAPELDFAPEGMVRVFSTLGVAGLGECNGLLPQENERLACSQDIHEIVELIVRGLAAVARRKDVTQR